jgi:2-polyprenyl-6-hydroxyphenyl methylase/3-demethylubiquinone-9 3-methyltransferase
MKDNSSEKDFANIDAAELAKFEAMAPIWWDRNGVQKPLHDINVLRVDYINTRVPLTGIKVLDVGCGGGILSESMAALGAVVTGIDASPAPLAVAKMHLKESGLRVDYRMATAETFAAEHSDRFDVVTCLEMLEHVPDPASVVAACQRLVKPGGDVLFAIIGAEYLLRMVRRGTHSYRKFVKPAELDGWAGAAGLILQDLTGLHYNPFLRRYSMGGNTHVNYMMHFRNLSAL